MVFRRLAFTLFTSFLIAPTMADPAYKSCIQTVGSYTYDLSRLAPTDRPLRYVSPDGRFTYLASLCGGSHVLSDSCKVTDAVAGM